MTITPNEKRRIETIKGMIKILDTTADAFIYFSDFRYKIDKEVFYRSFDSAAEKLLVFIKLLKDCKQDSLH